MNLQAIAQLALAVAARIQSDLSADAAGPKGRCGRPPPGR